MNESYGSHVLTALQRFINTNTDFVAEHDAKLKILEKRLSALESARERAERSESLLQRVRQYIVGSGRMEAQGDPLWAEVAKHVDNAAKGE